MVNYEFFNFFFWGGGIFTFATFYQEICEKLLVLSLKRHFKNALFPFTSICDKVYI